MRQNTIVNVIDLEATCWENSKAPVGEISEIIEIGLVEVDLLARERISRRSILVKPENSKVSEFCTALTGHTQKSLDQNGIPFETAMDILKQEFKMKNRTMVSWGDYDLLAIQNQCMRLDIPLPRIAHLNLKRMFSMMVNPTREVGMDRALGILKLPLNGRHHSGVDDAWNISGILLDLQRSIVVDL